MIGTYKTTDDCIYEVFLSQPDKRKAGELKVKCIQSTVRSEGHLPFTPIPGQLERNIILNKTWTKIEL